MDSTTDLLIVSLHIHSSNSFMNLLWMSCSQKLRTPNFAPVGYMIAVSVEKFIDFLGVIMSPVLTAHYCHSSIVWAKNIVHVDLSTSTFYI